MDEADAHGAVGQAEPLHDLDRVVVARPHGDVARGQLVGDLEGRAAGDVHGEGRGAAVRARDAVERHPVRQAGEEAFRERALLRLDRIPAGLLDVLDRGDEAGEELVLLRAGLEAGGRADRRAPGAPCTGAARRAAPRGRRRGPGAARRTCTASRAGRPRPRPRRRSGRAARSGRRRSTRARPPRARERRSGPRRSRFRRRSRPRGTRPRGSCPRAAARGRRGRACSPRGCRRSGR